MGLERVGFYTPRRERSTHRLRVVNAAVLDIRENVGAFNIAHLGVRSQGITDVPFDSSLSVFVLTGNIQVA